MNAGLAGLGSNFSLPASEKNAQMKNAALNWNIVGGSLTRDAHRALLSTKGARQDEFGCTDHVKDLHDSKLCAHA